MMIGLGVATLLGAGLSFIGGLFGNAINSSTASNNMKLQERINNTNIAFQKQENDITRQREDNAVQRAAADMEAAGLSKTLAAGNPASAQALQAPQSGQVSNEFKYESALQKMNIAQLLQNMAEKEKQLDLAEKKNDAEVNFINQQAKGVAWDNEHKAESFQAEIAVKNAQAFLFRKQGEYQSTQDRLARLTEPYVVDKIKSEISENVWNALKFKSDIRMNDKQIDAMAYDVAYKVMQIKDIKYGIKKKKAEVQKLVYDMTKDYYEIEKSKHDLNYAQFNNLPVGVSPNGTYGSFINAARALGFGFGFRPDNQTYRFNFGDKIYTSEELVKYLDQVNGFDHSWMY